MGTAEVHRVRSHSRRNHVSGLSLYTYYFQHGQRNETYTWSLFEKKIEFNHFYVSLQTRNIPRWLTNAECWFGQRFEQASSRTESQWWTYWAACSSSPEVPGRDMSSFEESCDSTVASSLKKQNEKRAQSRKKKKSFESHSYEAHNNANHKNIKECTWLVFNTPGWSASTKLWKLAVGEKPNTCLSLNSASLIFEQIKAKTKKYYPIEFQDHLVMTYQISKIQSKISEL